MEKHRFTLEIEVTTDNAKLISVTHKTRLPRRPGRPTKAESTEMGVITTSDNFGRLASAMRYVKDYLCDKQYPSALLFLEAAESGHAKKTIYRAAKMLGVIKRPVGHGHAQEWMWSLPKDDKQTDVAHSDRGPESTLDAEAPALDLASCGDRERDGK